MIWYHQIADRWRIFIHEQLVTCGHKICDKVGAQIWVVSYAFHDEFTHHS